MSKNDEDTRANIFRAELVLTSDFIVTLEPSCGRSLIGNFYTGGGPSCPMYTSHSPAAQTNAMSQWIEFDPGPMPLVGMGRSFALACFFASRERQHTVKLFINISSNFNQTSIKLHPNFRQTLKTSAKRSSNLWKRPPNVSSNFHQTFENVYQTYHQTFAKLFELSMTRVTNVAHYGRELIGIVNNTNETCTIFCFF